MEVFFMPKTKKRRNRPDEKTDSKSYFLKKVIKGGIACAVIYFIFLLLCALAVMKLRVTDSMQNIGVFSLAPISAFLASYFSLRKNNERGLYSGVLIAFCGAIITSLVLFAIVHTLGTKTILMALLMIIGGALGGITAVNSQKK